MRYAIDGRCIQDHFPGIARYTWNLVRALASHARDDEFVLLYDPLARNTRYELSPLAEEPNVRLVPGAAPLFSAGEQWQIPHQLRTLGPSVIHLPYYLRPYALPAPEVITAHDLIPLIHPEYFSLKERAIFRLAMGLDLSTARRVIAVSQATANDLQRHYRVSGARLVVIPEAADPAFAPQPAEAIAAIRQRYHLPEGYVLYLGSNKPHKNLVRLVEAWQQAAARVTPAVLAIAGHWDARYPQAQERAAALGIEDRIRFVGPVAEEDLPAVYSGAQLFVFPSLYEGFGLPVLEALACGVPVVCANTSSLPEVAGDAALLVDPLYPPALTEAICRVLEDAALARDLRARGLAQARRYSWEHTARETLAVYRQAL